MAQKVFLADPLSGKDIEKLAFNIVYKFQPEVLVNPKPFDIESFCDFDMPNLCGFLIDYRDLSPLIYGYTNIEQKEIIISSQIIIDA